MCAYVTKIIVLELTPQSGGGLFRFSVDRELKEEFHSSKWKFSMAERKKGQVLKRAFREFPSKFSVDIECMRNGRILFPRERWGGPSFFLGCC